MKQFLIILTILFSLQMPAQDFNSFTQIKRDNKLDNALRESFARDMNARNAHRQILPVSRLTSDLRSWTNGLTLFVTYYDPDERSFSLDIRDGAFPHDIHDPIRPLVLKGKKRITFSENDNGISFTLERFGSYELLVGRTNDGKPHYAYYSVPNDDFTSWQIPLFCILAGNYITSEGHHAVIGPRLDFYEGERFETDPGVFCAFAPANDATSLHILYGDSRVSSGDPSSDRYGKMPGGGGAGAVMGPMQWQLTPTLTGMLVNVIIDHKFVNHQPPVQDDTEIRRIQSPYQGISGQWPFTSVIPLTHQLLRLFPREVLTLMRGEIYARHGDTFRDPDTQRYFNSQPWYKKSAGTIKLTDIETFNYNLIRAVEQSL